MQFAVSVTRVPALTGPAGVCWIVQTGAGGLTNTVMLATGEVPNPLDAVMVNVEVLVMLVDTICDVWPATPGPVHV